MQWLVLGPLLAACGILIIAGLIEGFLVIAGCPAD